MTKVTLRSRGEYKESIKSYQSAITLCYEQYGADADNSMLAELYEKLSQVCKEDGQAEKSEEYRKKAAELRGGHLSGATEQQFNEESSTEIKQQSSQEQSQEQLLPEENSSQDESKTGQLSEASPDQEQDMDNSGNAETDTLTKQIKELVINGDNASVVEEGLQLAAAGAITEVEE